WFWNFGDSTTSTSQNPSHQYESGVDYTVELIVENANGCRDTVSRSPLKVLEPDLTIPNVFTPNGDGINDKFLITYRGLGSFELIIYDRWGSRLWSTNNTATGWDGGNYPEGVYYYYLVAGEIKKSGSFTLLR
ncbi:MAG: gliding motility-associated C-terminal domain-containing protein, partial [Bacteroidia bacterium]|nr:gliding motility-associated C-terminal domain-containing protein [Bacteroidia bacterium]